MLFVEFRFLVFPRGLFRLLAAVRKPLAQNLVARLQLRVLRGVELEISLLLMGSTGLDYLVGTMLARERRPGARRAWLLLSLSANFGTLALFKYCNYFIGSGAALLGWLGLPASFSSLNIIIPVGVSFYTFQSMSYTIEVYRGRLRAVSNLLDLAFFISFFPQLVAGPIFRAAVFLPQVATARKFSRGDVRGALVLFLTGFIKKPASPMRSRLSPIAISPRRKIHGRQRVGRGAVLCHPNLLRFLRLHRHGDRLRPAPRLRADDQF